MCWQVTIGAQKSLRDIERAAKAVAFQTVRHLSRTKL
jgi:hypothetical protein